MLSKYDVDFKKECFNNYFKEYKVLLKEAYKNCSSVYDSSVGEYVKYFDFQYFKKVEFVHSFQEYDCCRLLDLSRKRKTSRVRKKIESFVKSGNAIFVTITFTDDVLKSTSKETRRRYVARYLKEHSSKYVANIDFGKKNGREHYHAVVTSDLKCDKWPYGAVNVKRTRTRGADVERISKYITKLTNHALKPSTASNSDRLIYSRNV